MQRAIYTGRLWVLIVVLLAALACNPFIDLRPAVNGADGDSSVSDGDVLDNPDAELGDEVLDSEEDLSTDSELDGDMPDSEVGEGELPDAEWDGSSETDSSESTQRDRLPYDGRIFLDSATNFDVFLYRVKSVAGQVMSQVQEFAGVVEFENLGFMNDTAAYEYEVPVWISRYVNPDDSERSYAFIKPRISTPGLSVPREDRQFVFRYSYRMKGEPAFVSSLSAVEFPMVNTHSKYLHVLVQSVSGNRMKLALVTVDTNNDGKLYFYKCTATVLSSGRLNNLSCDLREPIAPFVSFDAIERIHTGSARITSVNAAGYSLLFVDYRMFVIDSNQTLATFGSISPNVSEASYVTVLDAAVDTEASVMGVSFRVESRREAGIYFCMFDYGFASGSGSITLRSCVKVPNDTLDDLLVSTYTTNLGKIYFVANSPYDRNTALVLAKVGDSPANDAYRYDSSVYTHGRICFDETGELMKLNVLTDGTEISPYVHKYDFENLFMNGMRLGQYGK